MGGQSKVWASAMLLVGAAVFGWACGEKKDANNPSDKPPPEETPKWEGAGSPPSSHPTDSKSASSGEPAPTSSATKTSSGGAVREAPNRRSDQYDKEGTEIALKRAARQVKDNCGAAKDDNGKAIGPWGKVSIQVQLGHNGHSKGTTIPSPYQGKPTGNCIEKAFTNLTFPPWAGADTQVDWEVELVEPGKEGKK
jgi:hypothetical protein